MFTYKYVVNNLLKIVQLGITMAQVRNQALLNLIALRIKKFREAQGITQEVFYHDTNINLGRIENGQTNISVSTLETICKYLNVTLKEFFAKDFEKLK